MTTVAVAREKRARAVELLIDGHSYEEIARRVGYAHRGSAYKAVSKALDERVAHGVDELRALEVERLDALQAALWESALAGDGRSVMAILRVIECRIRLLGLGRPETTLGPGKQEQWLVRPPKGNPWEATA